MRMEGTRSRVVTLCALTLVLLAAWIPPAVAQGPDIDVQPTTLGFGTVRTGVSRTLTTTIRNLGGTDLSVSEFAFTGSGDFAPNPAAPTPPFVVAPGGVVDVPIDYTPTVERSVSAVLWIASNDPDESIVSVQLTGQGEGHPEIDVAPLALDFGTRAIGTAATRTTTISNLGSGALAVSGLTITGTTEFTTSPAAPFTVLPGGFANVTVSYAPVDETADTATLDIENDDLDEPVVSVTLSGAGRAPAPTCDVSVTPTALDFGTVPVGTSQSRSTTVSNLGMSNCTVTLALTGSIEFALGAPEPFTLAFGQAAPVPVVYAPVDGGPDSGTLAISSNDPDAPAVLVLLSGAAPADPHAELPFPPGRDVCYVCHAGRSLTEQRAVSTEVCLQCHSDNWGTDPTLVPYPVPAPPANLHGTSVTGSTRFEYEIKCTSCHNPHDQSNRYGWQQIKYVKDFLFLPGLQVTDLTQTPAEIVTKDIANYVRFTHRSEFDYVDPNPFIRGICNSCHTQTDYHRNTTLAPAGSPHNDGATCTNCHTHVTGFSPSGGRPAPPHDTQPFLDNCDYCHVPGPGGGLDFGARVPDAQCQQCHAPGGALKGSFPNAPDVVTHSGFGCVDCHNPMFPQDNLKGIRSTLAGSQVPGSPITFTARSGPGSFADGPPFQENVCETCHSQTDHHRYDGSAPGDQGPSGYIGHFDGQTCTSCHPHDRAFVPTPHPQAVTDCSNCHVSRTTGQPDLQGLHGNACTLCHTSNFEPATFTFLGPIGTWNQECSACHNPTVAETGNLATPTKGHRCVACHGQQRSTADIERFHSEHAGAANCVVCHGFVPNTNVQIGSGNRDNCHLCHGTSKDRASIERLHRKMVPEGLSCVECHGEGQRPPVDVVPGTPVGSAQHVCQICHRNREPGDFVRHSERLHKRHTRERLDCGACHQDAELQDDRDPMPPADDPVRAQLNRGGFGACTHCHRRGEPASVTYVHRRHVAGQWQWCFTCHPADDPRPPGLEPPVTEPQGACRLCHDTRQYADTFPFAIHETHASRNKCYACHQTVPPLTNWPEVWLAP